MSSRFLNRLDRRHPACECLLTRERSRPRLHEYRFGTNKEAAIIALALALLTSCSAAPEKAKSPEKHYIEPPAQTKIPASETALRVCADPNNLPFSNEKQEGFENKIAELIAKDMDSVEASSAIRSAPGCATSSSAFQPASNSPPRRNRITDRPMCL